MLCQKFFKKDKPLSFIASLDANSLYSSTLDMAHIIGGFSLLNEAEINDFFIFLFFYKTVNTLIVGTMTELSKKRTRCRVRCIGTVLQSFVTCRLIHRKRRNSVIVCKASNRPGNDDKFHARTTEGPFEERNERTGVGKRYKGDRKK